MFSEIGQNTKQISKTLSIGLSLITISAILIPLGLSIIYIFSPCFPTFAGLALKAIYGNEACLNSGKYLIFSLFTIVRISLILFDCLIYTQASFSASFNCFHLLTTTLISLWEHLKLLNQQKIFLNLNVINKKMRIFKILRVLDNLSTAAFSSIIIPSFASLLCICQICTTFICLMLKNSISTSIYFLYLITLLDSIVFILIFTTAASKIYTNSNEFLESMRFQIGNFTNFKKVESKLTWLELKACSHLNVKFGTNFFEAKTPLVFQDFCWTTCASAVLLYRSNN